MAQPQITGTTKFGSITITSNGHGITALRFYDRGGIMDDDRNADSICKMAWKQVEEWFNHKRTDFDLPLIWPVSPELKKWLFKLREVPYGETMSYEDFAVHAGFTVKAARAAGNACSNNPIPLIIPCHRILRKNGGLGNFGAIKEVPIYHDINLMLKKALIDHEARNG